MDERGHILISARLPNSVGVLADFSNLQISGKNQYQQCGPRRGGAEQLQQFVRLLSNSLRYQPAARGAWLPRCLLFARHRQKAIHFQIRFKIVQTARVDTCSQPHWSGADTKRSCAWLGGLIRQPTFQGFLQRLSKTSASNPHFVFQTTGKSIVQCDCCPHDASGCRVKQGKRNQSI